MHGHAPLSRKTMPAAQTHEVPQAGSGPLSEISARLNATPRVLSLRKSGDGLNGAVAQRLEITLPHPTNARGDWTVDTAGENRQYLKGWIDESAKFNQEGLRILIERLGKIAHPSDFERDMLHLAQARRVDPVIGLPGVSYLGPSRPQSNKVALTDDPVTDLEKFHEDLPKPIHRGESEVEMADYPGRGVIPCMRLYMVAPKPEKLDREPTDPVGKATSDYKDVQQGEDGRIIISSGSNPNVKDDKSVYMNAGWPLRAVKWAAKYKAEHAAKGTPGILPVIRSFLVPLDKFQELAATAVHQDDKKELEAISGNPLLENSDQQAAPNQYGFSPHHLTMIREMALPNSLVTHTEEPDKLREVDADLNKTALEGQKMGSGEIRSTKELRERLGVPEPSENPLGDSLWIQGQEFAGHRAEGGQAKTLNKHYATWLQYEARKTKPGAPDSLLLNEESAKIPYAGRLIALRKFLTEQKMALDEPQVAIFMNKVVAPYASLGAATFMLGEDYGRLASDTSLIGGVGGGNNFHEQRRNDRARRSAELTTGEAIDAAVLNPTVTPAAILELLIHSHPELARAFAETSNPTEKYRFYDHAQLVLEKYLRIVRLAGNATDKRVLPVSAIVKMILFHDMHKRTSRWQYGTPVDGVAKEGRINDKDAEHVLPPGDMLRYGALWGEGTQNQTAARRTRRMVDADPIGEFFKGKDNLEELHKAFLSIVDLAVDCGVPLAQYPQFFKELHQFYQADFSSYTSTGNYVAWNDRKTKTVSKSKDVFDKNFDIQGGDITESADHTRLTYAQKNEAQYQKLSALFASPEIISVTLDVLRPAVKPAKKDKVDAIEPEDFYGPGTLFGSDSDEES